MQDLIFIFTIKILSVQLSVCNDEECPTRVCDCCARDIWNNFGRISGIISRRLVARSSFIRQSRPSPSDIPWRTRNSAARSHAGYTAVRRGRDECGNSPRVDARRAKEAPTSGQSCERARGVTRALVATLMSYSHEAATR